MGLAFSQLPALTGANMATGDLVAVSDVSAGSGGSVKMTASELAAGLCRLYSISRVIAASGTGINNTGNTTENTLVTVAIPANSLGPNGYVKVITHWTATANTNTKTFRVKFGATTYMTIQHTTATQQTTQAATIIQNRGATNSQVSEALSNAGFTNGINNPIVTGSDDTTGALNVVITAQCNTSGTDTVTLDRYIIEVCYVP